MKWPLVQKQPKQPTPVAFAGWPGGLRTAVPSQQLRPTEAAELVNFLIQNRAGHLQTRPPIKKYSNQATASNAAVKTICYANVAGTMRFLIVDANHKIDYLDGSLNPTNIGTLEGETQILPYKGIALLLDGSFIKYLDGVSAVKMAYDDGSGASAYQFNNRTGTDDTHTDLGNGTNTRVATKVTTQAWETGYTLPPTTLYATLKRAGNGYTGTDNVDVEAKIRKVSDDSVMASKTIIAAPIATNLASDATEYEITFASGDITTELAKSTAYYVTLEYNNGDATHHVEVHATTVASGGTGYYYDGSWNAEATKTPLMGLKPGMPPKGAFGAVHKGRPFIAGDPDNPGYVWFGNLTYLDWSTTDGGGYVGAVDSDANSFEVGAIASFYGDLFVMGKQSAPYLCSLSGTTPSDYALNLTFQNIWTTHRLLKSTKNDLWFANADGADSLTGVQDYGDLRTFSYSDPVWDRFRDYWSTSTALAAYDPKYGLYLIYMPSYHRLLVGHIRLASVDALGRQSIPWTEWELTRDILTSSSYKWTASGSGTNEYYLTDSDGNDPGFDVQPDFIVMDGVKLTEGTAGSLDDHEWDYGDNDTLGFSTVYIRDSDGDPDSSGVDIRSVLAPTCLALVNGEIYFGANDGYVYKFDESEYKELDSHQLRYGLRTAYVQFPFDYYLIKNVQIDAAGEFGGQLTLNLFTNDTFKTAKYTKTFALSADDRLTVDDMAAVLVDEAYFAVDPEQNPLFRDVMIKARSFQAEITDLYLAAKPVFLNRLFFNVEPLK